MTAEQFDSLVKRLETKAASQPRAYKLRVFLLAILGYAYIVGVLVVLALLVWLVFYVAVRLNLTGSAIGRIVLALLGLAALIIRSLWVRLPAPEGLALEREQAPQLFQEVDEIRRSLQAPRVHQIMLTEEFNASVAQVPRLGLLGWQRNYLILGLPFLLALPPEQFRAVLAHEFGHLSRAHGRFGAWIYRVRRTWAQLIRRLEERGHTGWVIFSPFFRWYIPFLSAYTFVLARAQEYEADRASVELAAAQTAADALVNTTVKDAFLNERFWPELWEAADDQAEPPAAFTEMRRALAAPLDPEEATTWLDDALAEETGSDNTHPALSERLAALGQQPRLPPPASQSAAEYYFGNTLAELIEHFNRDWREQAGPSWRERHAFVQNARMRLHELEEKAGREPLELDEAWERAYLTDELHGSEASLPLFQEYLQRDPDDPGANYAVGRGLLVQDRPEGIDFIVKAMERDPDAIIPGTKLIYPFLIEQGREQEAETYYERARQHAELLEAAEAERDSVSVDDTYLPHGLSPAEVEHLQAQLRRYPEIKRAYLVRKRLEYFLDQRLYVMGIIVRGRFWRLRAEKRDKQLVQRLIDEVEFPGETFVMVVNYEARYQMFKAILKKVPGSEIYRG